MYSTLPPPPQYVLGLYPYPHNPHALPALSAPGPLAPAYPLKVYPLPLPLIPHATLKTNCPEFVYSPYSTVCARCHFHSALHKNPATIPRPKEDPLRTPSSFELEPERVEREKQENTPSPTASAGSTASFHTDHTAHHDAAPHHTYTPTLPPISHGSETHPTTSGSPTITMSQSSYTNLLQRLSRLESYFYQENLSSRVLLQNAQLMNYEYHKMKELGEQLEEEVMECCERIEEGEERLERLEEERRERERREVYEGQRERVRSWVKEGGYEGRKEEGRGRSLKRGWEEEEEEEEYDSRGEKRSRRG